MLERVQKLISNYGYCSRRKAEELIKNGKVKVNDKVISIGDKASEKDQIKIDDKLIDKEKRIYLIFNKPLDCVTAVRDKKYKTVLDHISISERIFPVGRLDANTTGLLILTNDGDFANKVMHPRYNVTKTYYVKLKDPITKKQIINLEKGVFLKDGKTSPAKVKRLNSKEIEITIHEGRKHIVRRMIKKVGLELLKLKRTRIGKLELGNLKEGKYKELKNKDLKLIFENGM